MLKAITEEVQVCDVCEQLPKGDEFLSKCEVCGKEVCGYCRVHLSYRTKNKQGWISLHNKYACREHLPGEVFMGDAYGD